MKSADVIPILGQPEYDSCSQIASTANKQLVFLFSLRGNNALNFSKDLSQQIETWLVASPEELHQKILDLLQFCHQQRLAVKFVTLCFLGDSLALASQEGSIFLHRSGQWKPIITADRQLRFVVGKLHAEDQFILATQTDTSLVEQITKMMQAQLGSEQILSQLVVFNQDHSSSQNALAEVEFKDNITINEKVVFSTRIKQMAGNLLGGFRSFFLHLPENSRRLVFFIRNFPYRKAARIALPITFLIAVLWGIFAFRAQRAQQVFAANQQKITNMTQPLAVVNTQLDSQPLAARQTAQQVLDQLQNFAKQPLDNKSRQFVEQEIQRVQVLIQDISGQNSLDRLEVAVDLAQLAPNFLGQKIRLGNQSLFILENNQQQILQINLTTHETQTISNPSSGIIRDFTVSDTSLLTLADGIWQIQPADQQNKQLKETGDSDQNANLITSFGNYLYSVNPTKRNVYRYTITDGELSQAIGWLTDKQGINFENITDIFVDGDLWLATSTGQVLRYNKGSKQDFTLQGLSAALDSSLLIEGAENSDKLIVLEKSKKHLLVFTKTGELLSEIKSNELASISDIAYDSQQNLVYALSGSLVYKISL